MLVVPLTPTPAQTFTITLAGQNVRINLYQKDTGLFADVKVNDAYIVAGVRCLNASPLVGSGYMGFKGNLTFLDLEGDEEPTYVGLGDRFFLAYTEPAA